MKNMTQMQDNQLVINLRNISSFVNHMADHKREQFFKDKILMNEYFENVRKETSKKEAKIVIKRKPRNKSTNKS